MPRVKIDVVAVSVTLLLSLLATPLPVAAQERGVPPPDKVPHVGVVIQGGPHYSGVEGLREGLKAFGLEEGKHVVLRVHDARGDLAIVEAAARTLESGGVRVIVAFSTSVTLAVKRTTTNVPVVFAAGSDPVVFGLVESIARPGGRLTGIHSLTTDVTAKRLEILREMVPTLRRVVTYYNPGNRMAHSAAQSALAAARQLGLELVAQEVTSLEAIRERLGALKGARADAYFFVSDSMVIAHDRLIIDAAHALRMATMAYELDLVARGALVGYGLNYREFGQQTARYVARILAGAHPKDLPVEAISKLALVINLKTAKALGLRIPQSLLMRADEMIQ